MQPLKIIKNRRRRRKKTVEACLFSAQKIDVLSENADCGINSFSLIVRTE